ncbi:hypothetical protein AVEN_235022-1 [Araneus ventricosus]|uniref:Reverse transcriptase/retrotransposon-derived protein RNase H-like domain-containing protein n=1 Tax=Araneus ventricosus TaxID=182803 RepID=A0A4Y2FMC5_ARAVE|nr:hypothetical protein AVEN_235022-1 [Araneus ventricosus]
MVAPLTETLKKKGKKLRQGKINWTEECTRAFKGIKDKLSQQPILYAPDFNKSLYYKLMRQTLVWVFSSKDDNDKEHPVLYLSKSFQRN